MKDINILTENGIDVKKSLELFGDMETYDQMLEEFLGEVDTKIANSKKFKDMGDMANYAIVVHSLKSDCRYFGMNELGEMFYEHELAGKRNDSFFVKQNYDNLIAQAVKMINVVKRYMGVITTTEQPTINQTQTVSESITNTEPAILVVDDSNIIRNFVQKIFSQQYKVLIANDGQDAINIVDNTPNGIIKCMLLDLNMPGVDGFQVLEHFKSANLFSKIPVSIISGANDKDTIDRAFTYPIVDMIQKPFTEERIKVVTEKTISRGINQ